MKFAKCHIYRVLEASKVKSDFSTYFSKEKSYSKKVFCIINLVHWKVYRVKKVGIYLLSLAKKSIFSNLHIPILGVILKKLFSQGATSDSILTTYDNSYTNRNSLSSLVEICCFQFFFEWFLVQKSRKTELKYVIFNDVL